MELPTSKYYKYKNFKISDNSIFENLEVAFQTWGELNKKK